jgi:hypothetical protein
MTFGETLSLMMIGGAAIVALRRTGSACEIALLMIAGVVVNRVGIWGIPDLRYLFGTAILATIGAAAIKRGAIVPGALLILSGLCHMGPEYFRLPPIMGNPFLLSSEILWWLALLGVYRGKLVGLPESILLGYSGGRDGILSRPRVFTLAKKAG